MQPVILAASGVLDWRSCSSYPWTYVSSTTAQCDEESWYQVWCHSFPHLDCTEFSREKGLPMATGCNWMQLVSYISIYNHIYPISSNRRYPGRRTKLRTSEFLDLWESPFNFSDFSISGLLGSIARFHKLQGFKESFLWAPVLHIWEVDTFFTLRPEKDYLAVWCLRGDRNCWGVGGQDLVPPRTLENIKNWNIHIIWKSYHTYIYIIYIIYI